MYIFTILCPRSVETSSVTKMGRDALNFRIYRKKVNIQENRNG